MDNRQLAARELVRLKKQEQKFLKGRAEKKDTAIIKLVKEKVPPKLSQMLEAAFEKAFWLVFEKGTGVIQLGFNKQERQTRFKIDSYSAQLRKNKKALRRFSKRAGTAGLANTAISSAAGMGLGLAGIGLPDVVLFTAIMLKSIYETALSFGYEYESDQERRFILSLICASVSWGEQLEQKNAQIDAYIAGQEIEQSQEQLIKEAAQAMATELMYMKFIQGIPLVGVLGGAWNGIYLSTINSYTLMKYKKRFYTGIESGQQSRE